MGDTATKLVFLRATGRGLATRYGPPHQYIGLSADAAGNAVRDDEGRLVIDDTCVVAIPEGEFGLRRREYQRQLREGALERVDEKAYKAHLAARAKASAEAAGAQPAPDADAHAPKKTKGADK